MAGVCEEECMGHSQGDELLTLTRCHGSGLAQLYEALGWKFSSWPSLQLKGHKGEICFLFSPSLSFDSFTVVHFMMRADPAVAGGGNVQ